MSVCSDDFEQSSAMGDEDDMDDFLPSEDEEPPSEDEADDKPAEDKTASGGARSDCLLIEHDGKYYEVPTVADFDPQRSAAAATVAGAVRYYGETFETANSLQKLADGDALEWKNTGYTFEDDIARRIVVVKGSDGRMSRYGWYFLLEHASEISSDSRILRPVPDCLFTKWWRALLRSAELSESKLKDMRPSNKGTCINPIDSGFKLYTLKVVSKVKLAPPPPKPAAEKKPPLLASARPRARARSQRRKKRRRTRSPRPRKPRPRSPRSARPRADEALPAQGAGRGRRQGRELCSQAARTGTRQRARAAQVVQGSWKGASKASAKPTEKPPDTSAAEQKFSEIGTATFEVRWVLDRDCKNLVFKIPQGLSPTMATGTIKLTLN